MQKNLTQLIEHTHDGLIFVFKFNFPSSKQPLKMSYFQNTATIPDPFFVVIQVITDQPQSRTTFDFGLPKPIAFRFVLS